MLMRWFSALKHKKKICESFTGGHNRRTEGHVVSGSKVLKLSETTQTQSASSWKQFASSARLGEHVCLGGITSLYALVIESQEAYFILNISSIHFTVR